MLLFLINMAMSLRGGATAEPNPWAAPTLEWATSSPPPRYNFAHIPVVDSRTPLWDSPGQLAVAHGLRVDERELLLTGVIDAIPDLREPSAQPSPWPFIAACATTVMFISSIFSPWGLLFGAVPAAIALIAWFWPKDAPPEGEPVIT
jgi:cytochrome c oxidase subunit 1